MDGGGEEALSWDAPCVRLHADDLDHMDSCSWQLVPRMQWLAAMYEGGLRSGHQDEGSMWPGSALSDTGRHDSSDG